MAQVTIEQVFNLALQHHQAGQLPEAEKFYRAILAHQPGHADALHLLGVLSAQSGRNAAAVELIQRALALNPNCPIANNNLGGALQGMGRLDEATAAYQRAIALRADYPDAYSNLGATLHDKGQVDDAIVALRRAVLLDPKNPLFHSNLASALNEKDQFDEAMSACRTALALSPHYAEAESNLGNALRGKGMLDESIAAFHRALAIKPDCNEAHYNLGIALQEHGRLEEAAGAYRQAIALKPSHAKAHRNLAFVLLAKGDFEAGWEEYEWRWNCEEHRPYRRNFVQPQWTGGPLAGQTILLHAEQGFGDTIQFLRYVPLVVGRGARVIVECQPELVRLIARTIPDIHVVARGQPLPNFDIHCPLMSLPRMMNTNRSNIPRNVPYLHAPAQDSETLRQRVASGSASINVGLAWAGRPQHKNDRNRSLALSNLAPLAAIPDVRFWSLQKGEAAADANAPTTFDLANMVDELHDFADTAALIANLDLVIAVDTAVAHLAGAMGKPVWVLLPFVADWRWMLERDDTPWYPTMRLFRQRSQGDWGSVVERVADALTLWVKSGKTLQLSMSLPRGQVIRGTETQRNRGTEKEGRI